jgi:hypothetical protein
MIICVRHGLQTDDHALDCDHVCQNVSEDHYQN